MKDGENSYKHSNLCIVSNNSFASSKSPTRTYPTIQFQLKVPLHFIKQLAGNEKHGMKNPRNSEDLLKNLNFLLFNFFPTIVLLVHVTLFVFCSSKGLLPFPLYPYIKALSHSSIHRYSLQLLEPLRSK